MSNKTMIESTTNRRRFLRNGALTALVAGVGTACKGAASSCKGLNACKGQGWTETTDVVSCTKQGGKVL